MINVPDFAVGANVTFSTEHSLSNRRSGSRKVGAATREHASLPPNSPLVTRPQGTSDRAAAADSCRTSNRRAVASGLVRRYLTRMRTRVSSKGQIVLPAELRQRDRIESGQEFDVERVDQGEYRLVRRAPRPNEGVIEWLLACPEKDFFVSIESESTDTL